MKKDRRRYLEFEKSLADLDEQISKLKSLKIQEDVDLSSDIRALEEKSKTLLQSICTELTSYQKVQLSRHPDRPNTLDYVTTIFDDFIEMHGDRAFREDPAIVGGLASLDGQTVMVVGHQKGRNTEENLKRNFGMPRPEGYRKALRLMKLAEQWNIPIVTFVDTPGAYPGLDAEERGQAEAIARNIMEMFGLRVPIVTVILGEGGSGGALAVAVCDRLLMLEYSIYSVISPEGCAAITWKNPEFMADAAEALNLTADHHKSLGTAEEIVKEALGGAHRDPFLTAKNLKEAVLRNLKELQSLSVEDLLEKRYGRFRKFGFPEQASSRSKKKSSGRG